ncbi:TMEM63C [Cordylochernes scorpioides]|uniref:TMEM63C n=1 Tax=Cordylochernes scorpioides TaxID=51811 RepID=A0ABY6L452_9ARAC|nr:TMEM63C [Cordylochernes scorpioides]
MEEQTNPSNDTAEQSVPKQETTFEEEETSPPQGTSTDPLTQIADALSKLLVARSPREIDVSPYDGTFEAQSFFDNFDAQADRAELTYTDRLRKLPCYLQDIAPNDFFLFPKLKAVLKGRHFDTRDDIIEKSPLALKSIPKEAYKNCFDNWEKRWRCEAWDMMNKQDVVNQRIATRNNYFIFFKSLLSVAKEDIYKKCGHDAYNYILFQQYLIFYLALVAVLSLGILLPVNLSGGELPGDRSYDVTTINNIDCRSRLIWIHVLSAGFLFPLIFIVLKKYVHRMKAEDLILYPSKSIILYGIPIHDCNEGYIREVIKSINRKIGIEKIKILYENSKVEIKDHLDRAISAREWCEQKSTERVKIKPKACGRFCAFPCCSELIDGVEFYKEEERRYRQLLQEEEKKFSPKGAAVVTFKTIFGAQIVKLSLKRVSLWSRIKGLAMGRVRAEYISCFEDIYWDNVSSRYKWWYVKSFLVNVPIIILFLGFTSPTMIMEYLNVPLKALGMTPVSYISSLEVVFLQALPGLILVMITASIPLCVAQSEIFQGHWKKSTANFVMFVKNYIYLQFSVLILPLVGQTNVLSFFFAFFQPEGFKVLLKCLRSQNMGAVFTHYLISMTFLSTSFDLLRVAELLVYFFSILTSRSKAESSYVRKKCIRDFQYGYNYSWILTSFTITTTFCVTNPLIVIFGLSYHIFQYFVDKNNLYFAYQPSKVNKEVHRAAINFAIWASIMNQVFLMLHIVNNGGKRDVTLFNAVILLVSLLIFLSTSNVFCQNLIKLPVLIVFRSSSLTGRVTTPPSKNAKDYEQFDDNLDVIAPSTSTV